jgi:hypothetical protein
VFSRVQTGLAGREPRPTGQLFRELSSLAFQLKLARQLVPEVLVGARA